jgi:hypothetical protein
MNIDEFIIEVTSIILSKYKFDEVQTKEDMVIFRNTELDLFYSIMINDELKWNIKNEKYCIPRIYADVIGKGIEKKLLSRIRVEVE